MRIESIKEISLLENERKIYDIIVVGGGPAGMTAALYGARNGKSVLILEKNGFGGQMVYSPRIENFPSRLSVSGSELADEMVGQIIEQGVEPGVERVTAVRDEGAVKTVVTDDGEHYARTVIIAAGVKHRMLGLEGEEQLVGSGISFCAVCDGEFFRGKRVAVAGGGNSALQEAILLSEYCERVTVVQDMDFLTGEQKSQDVLKAKENVDIITGTTITALRSEDGLLKGIGLRRTSDGAESALECDGLFVAIGLIPENEAFANVLKLNGYGYAETGADCAAGSGIFAAGDCRAKDIRQITTAMSDGATAAVMACRYIDSL